MAKKPFTTEVYQNAPFDIEHLAVADSSSKSVTFVSQDDFSFTFKGDRFRYDDGMLDKGKVHELKITDADGDLVLRALNFTIDASSVAGDTAEEFYNIFTTRFQNFDARVIAKGNSLSLSGFGHDDVIVGGRGDDNLNGREGRDVMTGGKGEDVFAFVSGYGKDTITDFDADISDGAQDLIDAAYDDIVAKMKVGRHDTLLDFGDGNTLRLLDVRPAEIDETDFLSH